MKKIIRVTSLFGLIFLLFSCEKNETELESLENKDFLTSVAIFDIGESISSKTSEDKLSYTLELKSFDNKYRLKEAYKINDIEYSDNGKFNDLIAGDGVYTSVNVFDSPKKSDLKISYSKSFKYRDKISSYSKKVLATSNKSNNVGENATFGITITCDIVTRTCPQTRWYNTCWFSDSCTCVYLENCQISVGIGIE